MLKALRFRHKRGWPRGVYEFGGEVVRVGVVVASELARTRDTLLVRLMAGGPLLPRAVEDLAALPKGAHERDVAEQILLRLRHALESRPIQTSEEKEFVVAMLSTWDDAREQGKLMQARSALRRVLVVRKLNPSAADEAKIDACTDLSTLDRWHDQAVVAQTVAEALKARAAAKASKARAATSASKTRTAASAPKTRSAASTPVRRAKSSRA